MLQHLLNVQSSSSSVFTPRFFFLTTMNSKENIDVGWGEERSSFALDVNCRDAEASVYKQM